MMAFECNISKCDIDHTPQTELDAITMNLFGSCQQNDLERVAKLINSGVDVNCQLSGCYNTLLNVAIDNKLTDMVRLLLDSGANPNKYNTIEYQPSKIPLVHALNKRSYEIIDMLLAYGANPNIEIDMHDATPIMHYSSLNSKRIMKRLLDAGANINAITSFNWNVLSKILTVTQDDMVLEMVKLVLDYGVDPHLIDDMDMAPIFTAIGHRHGEEIVRLLYEYGADINLCARTSPLSYAIWLLNDMGNDNVWRIIKQLIDLGVDLTVRSKKCIITDDYEDAFDPELNGNVPLHYAVQEDPGAHMHVNHDVVQLLIKSGIDIDGLDQFDNTAVFRSVYNDNIVITKLLVDAGAGINRQNIYGYSLLHISVSKGYYDMTKYLLDLGIDTGLMNYKDITAVEIAGLNRSSKLVELIKKYDVPTKGVMIN